MIQLVVDQDVVLKEISLSSAEIIFQSIENSRKYLAQWLPFAERTTNVNDTINFINYLLFSPEGKKEKVFEIWHKGFFAGLIGMKDINEQYKKLELGYWLDEQMQGKGLIRKSCNALLEFIFYEMKMNRIMIKVAVGNNKSAAIPKELGFSFEGIEREGESLHGRFVNLEVYSLLKKEWIRR